MTTPKPRPLALACSLALLALACATLALAAEEHPGAPLGPPGPPAPSGSNVSSPRPDDPAGATAHAGRDAGRGGAEILWEFPPEQPADRALLRVRTKPLRRDRASGNGGLLQTVRALDWAAGEARILVPREGERVVRAGDVIGTDTVTRVEDHRLRLTRPDPGQPGPALVVVSFDGRGEPFVRVYSQRNPPPPDPGQGEANLKPRP